MAVKTILKGILAVIAAAMVLMSIPMSQQSLLGGLAFLTLPVGWLVLTLLRTIVKSIWAVGFVFLALGTLEIILGVGQSLPVSGALYLAGTMFYLIFEFISTLINFVQSLSLDVGFSETRFKADSKIASEVSPKIHPDETEGANSIVQKELFDDYKISLNSDLTHL